MWCVKTLNEPKMFETRWFGTLVTVEELAAAGKSLGHNLRRM